VRFKVFAHVAPVHIEFDQTIRSRVGKQEIGSIGLLLLDCFACRIMIGSMDRSPVFLDGKRSVGVAWDTVEIGKTARVAAGRE
jgi:hypothetical protein